MVCCDETFTALVLFDGIAKHIINEVAFHIGHLYYIARFLSPCEVKLIQEVIITQPSGKVNVITVCVYIAED